MSSLIGAIPVATLFVFMRLLIKLDPFLSFVLFASCSLLQALHSTLFSWWMHFQLAALVSSSHKAAFQPSSRLPTIRSNPRFLPPLLWKLLACLMVLSAVMQSETMWPSLPSVPSPVTFMEVAASVHILVHPLAPRCLPPDKTGLLILTSFLQSLAMEREKCYNWMVNFLLPADDSPAPTTSSTSCPSNACDFRITTGCSSYVLSALNQWSDFHTHVCNTGCLNSFGPIGLLSAPSLFQAVVDTGASLLVSHTTLISSTTRSILEL